jgi:hypothetical protein
MSIFDRKRSVPEPDYEPEPEPQPRYHQPEARQQAQPAPAAQPVAPAQPAPAPVAAAPASSSRGGAHGSTGASAYGIQKAIELMRSLPADNIPLIVQVVRTTLESTNVDVPSIIEDAKAKRSRISSRVEGLRREIANFEEEIAARREEIVALDADYAETKLVQERLEMGMKASSASASEMLTSRLAAGPTRLTLPTLRPR